MKHIPKSLTLLLKMLRSQSHRLKAGITANVVCGCLTVVTALVAVWITREIVDAAVIADRPRLVKLSVVFCILLLLRIVSSRAGQRIEAWCITRFSNRMRSRLFDRVMLGRFNAATELHSADVVNRLSTDVGNVSAALCSTLPAIAVSAVSLLGAYLFLAILTPVIAIAVTAVMPIALLIAKYPAGKTHRLTREIREEETAITRLLQDDVSHRMLVATLGHSSKAAADFNRRQTNFFRLTMKRNDLSILAGGAVTLGFMGGYGLMLLYCAFGIADGTVSFATMTALLQLVAMVQRPVVDLSHKLSPIVRAMVSAERLQELDDIYRRPHIRHMGDKAARGDLRFEDVWFRYNSDSPTHLLSDFNETIPTGKVTTVYGETGSGKTTLLKLMLGICTPERGRILSPFASDGFSRVIYVPQGNTLLSGTVMTNLLMGKPDATPQEIALALHLAAADFVARLPEGVDTRCGENGYGFSEGQAQRLAIARGILRLMAVREHEKGHVLVLLDEPTSALDSRTSEKMMERLIPYMEGLTVVIITHKEGLRKYSHRTIRLGE